MEKSMEKTNHDECRGCLINELIKESAECVFKTNRKWDYYKCPCLMCLIKGMCEKSCDEYKQYSNLK